MPLPLPPLNDTLYPLFEGEVKVKAKSLSKLNTFDLSLVKFADFIGSGEESIFLYKKYFGTIPLVGGVYVTPNAPSTLPHPTTNFTKDKVFPS